MSITIEVFCDNPTYRVCWGPLQLTRFSICVQESLRPFPWTRACNAFQRGQDSSIHAPAADDQGMHGSQTKCSRLAVGMPTKVLDVSRNNRTAGGDFEFLEYKLPPQNATAGRILHHAKMTVDKLFTKHSPMIFKIGYTHSPSFRWNNELYGYKHARDKWTNMVVLFESPEVHGPAFLEACLIDAYKSTWMKN